MCKYIYQLSKKTKVEDGTSLRNMVFLFKRFKKEKLELFEGFPYKDHQHRGYTQSIAEMNLIKEIRVEIASDFIRIIEKSEFGFDNKYEEDGFVEAAARIFTKKIQNLDHPLETLRIEADDSAVENYFEFLDEIVNANSPDLPPKVTHIYVDKTIEIQCNPVCYSIGLEESNVAYIMESPKFPRESTPRKSKPWKNPENTDNSKTYRLDPETDRPYPNSFIHEANWTHSKPQKMPIRNRSKSKSSSSTIRRRLSEPPNRTSSTNSKSILPRSKTPSVQGKKKAGPVKQ
uniref:SPK domain-containing protein n=1 Tax=Caenorhabditis tropicalis TaxID=1561998 RepID=A0A1I7UV36_9PELO